MNKYELMDIGATYTDLLHTAYKFWTTTTFALVAAAYIAGPDLGLWISVGIAVVYLSLAIGNLFTVRLYTSTIAGTIEDIKAISEADDRSWASIQPLKTTVIMSTVPMLLTVMTFSSVGSVIYLFHRVGYIG